MYSTWFPLASDTIVNFPESDVALVGELEPDMTNGGQAAAHPPLQTFEGGASEVR